MILNLTIIMGIPVLTDLLTARHLYFYNYLQRQTIISQFFLLSIQTVNSIYPLHFFPGCFLSVGLSFGNLSFPSLLIWSPISYVFATPSPKYRLHCRAVSSAFLGYVFCTFYAHLESSYLVTSLLHFLLKSTAQHFYEFLEFFPYCAIWCHLNVPNNLQICLLDVASPLPEFR